MFLYQKIAEQLRKRSTAAGSGSVQLPSERQLCAEYNVSRVTIRKSIALLKDQGVLYSYEGRGTYTGAPMAAKKRLVAIVMEDHLPISARQIVFSVYNYLLRVGYQVMLTDERAAATNSGMKNFELTFKDYKPAGYILISSAPSTQRWFMARKIPTLVIGYPVSANGPSYVTVQQFPIFYNSVYHLYKEGHRNIALLFRSSVTGGNRDLLRGFHQACAELDIAQPPENIIHIQETKSSIQNAIDEVLSQARRPSALVLHNQDIAVPALSYLQHRRISIPKDMAVLVGPGDSLCDQFKVRLTHTDIGSVDLAKMVAEGIVSLIKNPEAKIQKQIKPRLVIRESSRSGRR